MNVQNERLKLIFKIHRWTLLFITFIQIFTLGLIPYQQILAQQEEKALSKSKNTNDKPSLFDDDGRTDEFDQSQDQKEECDIERGQIISPDTVQCQQGNSSYDKEVIVNVEEHLREQAAYQRMISDVMTANEKFLRTTEEGKAKTRMRQKTIWKDALGAFVGMILTYLAKASGIPTANHEYIGHLKLGGEFMYDYNGSQPLDYGNNIQIDGFENLKNITDMSSFWRWFSSHDTHGDHASGWARPSFGSVGPSNLSQHLSSLGKENQTSAWISLSGSVPGLVVHTLAFLMGEKLFQQTEFWGPLLMMSGLFQHAMDSTYPISVSLMSQQEIVNQSKTGHDFANFAIKTDISPIITAGLFTSSVPLIALFNHFYLYSGNDEIVPDHIALMHWLKKAQTDESVRAHLEKILENYPRKSNLIEAHTQLAKKSHCNAKRWKLNGPWYKENNHFVDYLLNQLSYSTLSSSKDEILDEWNKLLRVRPFEKWVDRLVYAGLLSRHALPFFRALAINGVEWAKTFDTGMTGTLPLLPALSSFKSGYHFVQDLKSESNKIPWSAKLLSGLQFAANLSDTAIMTWSSINLFQSKNMSDISGLAGWWELPTSLCLKGVSAACGYFRSRILRKQFKKHQEEYENERSRK